MRHVPSLLENSNSVSESAMMFNAHAMCPQCLPWNLAHCRCSINDCWLKEGINILNQNTCHVTGWLLPLDYCPYSLYLKFTLQLELGGSCNAVQNWNWHTVTFTHNLLARAKHMVEPDTGEEIYLPSLGRHWKQQIEEGWYFKEANNYSETKMQWIFNCSTPFM